MLEEEGHTFMQRGVDRHVINLSRAIPTTSVGGRVPGAGWCSTLTVTTGRHYSWVVLNVGVNGRMPRHWLLSTDKSSEPRSGKVAALGICSKVRV